MSAAGRARIIALVEAIAPTLDRAVRFRAVASGKGGGIAPLAAGPATRRFELVTLQQQRDSGSCHASGADVLYAATWGVRVAYAAPQGQDPEYVARLIESDERDIVGALATGWEADLEMALCSGGATVQQSPAGLTMTVPVEVMYYP